MDEEDKWCDLDKPVFSFLIGFSCSVWLFRVSGVVTIGVLRADLGSGMGFLRLGLVIDFDGSLEGVDDCAVHKLAGEVTEEDGIWVRGFGIGAVTMKDVR